jgi:hypothetical protein
MKKIFAISSIVLLSAFYYADDILTKTGLSQDMVKEKILFHASDKDASSNVYALDVLMPGSFDQTLKGKAAKAFATTKAIITGQRAGVVQQFGTYMKNYYNSAQFKKDFAQKIGPAPLKYKDSAYLKLQYDSTVKYADMALEANKKNFSKENTNAIKSQVNKSMNASDEAMKRAIEMIEKNPELLAQSGMTKEEFMAKMANAQGQTKKGKKEAQKQMDESMSDEKNNEAIQKAQQDHDEKIAQAKKDLEYALERVPDEAARYHEALAEYNKRKDYKTNLKNTLQLFLQETADVDFKASLRSRGTIKYFENNAYERKSKIWKACYRAGAEATNAARNFAQQWIKEL